MNVKKLSIFNYYLICIVHQELVASKSGILGHHSHFSYLSARKTIEFIQSIIQKNHSWSDEIVGQIFQFFIGGDPTGTIINDAISQERLFSNGRIEIFALMPKFEFYVSSIFEFIKLNRI